MHANNRRSHLQVTAHQAQITSAGKSQQPRVHKLQRKQQYKHILLIHLPKTNNRDHSYRKRLPTYLHLADAFVQSDLQVHLLGKVQQ